MIGRLPARRPEAVSAAAIAAALVLGLVAPARGQPAAGANVYTSPPIHGLVVSAVTGRPVPGAAVFAFWRWRPPDPLFGAIHVSEAVTGADGTFTLPGWRRSIERPVDPEASGVVVLAPGYAPADASFAAIAPGRRLRIELPPAAPDPARRAERLRGYLPGLIFILAGLPRQPLPKIVDALVAERDRLSPELRETLPDRAGFEWLVDEYRAAHEQAAGAAERE
ncbi:MAG TPA: carboxypeptidase-like regulatory domain-containing protein [Candidatus Binatia bacterium]|nr:carboxypeptidase-like regulatory domain-containing protein [Candidatus Binatia bacterium]